MLMRKATKTLPARRTPPGVAVSLLCLAIFGFGSFGARALGAGISGSSAVGNGAEISSMPPADCLRILREARIARMNRDLGGELAGLQAAWAAFPGELAVASDLLERHQRDPLPDELYGEVLAALEQRMANLELPLPYGVLARAVQDPGTTDEVLALFLESLEPRSHGGQAESEDPKTVDAKLLRLLARLQVRLAQEEAALETMEKLWKHFPSESLRWPLVQLNVKLERWPRVLELMKGEGHDTSTYRRDLYFEALSKAGSYDEVARLVEELLPTSPPPVSPTYYPGFMNANVEIVKRAAWNFRDRGMDAESEKLFRRVLAAMPNDTESRGVLLHLYGSVEERQEHADALAEKWEEEIDPQELFEEGTQRLTNGNVEGAFELLQRAAPHFPDLEAAWYNYGMAAYRLERWDSVADAFSNAARLNEARLESFLYLGIALQHLNRCPEAVAALERVVSLDPAQTKAHYYLSNCFKILGDTDSARRHMEAYRAARGTS